MWSGGKVMEHNVFYKINQFVWTNKLFENMENTHSINSGIFMAIKIHEFPWPWKFVASQFTYLKKFNELICLVKTDKLIFLKKKEGGI